ncbi:hypothetical protein Tco_1514296, partial [Tanacetum coccineum]
VFVSVVNTKNDAFGLDSTQGVCLFCCTTTPKGAFGTPASLEGELGLNAAPAGCVGFHGSTKGVRLVLAAIVFRACLIVSTTSKSRHHI